MCPGCCIDLTLTAALQAADGACWRSVARLVLPGERGETAPGGRLPSAFCPPCSPLLSTASCSAPADTAHRPGDGALERSFPAAACSDCDPIQCGSTTPAI